MFSLYFHENFHPLSDRLRVQVTALIKYERVMEQLQFQDSLFYNFLGKQWKSQFRWRYVCNFGSGNTSLFDLLLYQLEYNNEEPLFYTLT